MKPTIEIGSRFGLLVTVARIADTRVVLCRCDCGTEVRLHWSQLGQRRSCGCLPPNRLPPRVAARNRMFTRRRADARARGKTFALTQEQAFVLFDEPCHYCGAEPSNVATPRTRPQEFRFSGIDRVDNREGYSPGNVVACCATCNRMKLELSVSDFFECEFTQVPIAIG